LKGEGNLAHWLPLGVAAFDRLAHLVRGEFRLPSHLHPSRLGAFAAFAPTPAPVVSPGELLTTRGIVKGNCSMVQKTIIRLGGGRQNCGNYLCLARVGGDPRSSKLEHQPAVEIASAFDSPAGFAMTASFDPE
jgi:hypothetical protein